MKNIWVLTMIPEMFEPFLRFGVVGSSLRGERGEQLPRLNLVAISDYCEKGFKGVDASPYGGGAGMVMRADILENALIKGVFEAGKYIEPKKELRIIATGPRGKIFDQIMANEIKDESRDIVFICGRYEGIDERFLDKYVDEHVSLGNFILSGGELACMSYIDAVVRLMDGALGNVQSALNESFEGDGLLEYPQYTRPQIACEKKVPEVLTGGDHKKIIEWRKDQSVIMTKIYRPELLELKK
jgi:tRNA (guanine37-N1)-methyltransferase